MRIIDGHEVLGNLDAVAPRKLKKAVKKALRLSRRVNSPSVRDETDIPGATLVVVVTNDNSVRGERPCVLVSTLPR